MTEQEPERYQHYCNQGDEKAKSPVHRFREFPYRVFRRIFNTLKPQPLPRSGILVAFILICHRHAITKPASAVIAATVKYPEAFARIGLAALIPAIAPGDSNPRPIARLVEASSAFKLRVVTARRTSGENRGENRGRKPGTGSCEEIGESGTGMLLRK